ncbi:ankyrin repeat and LEM domain-containing protein 2-like [Oppia nitens]|uniref:ankyrin repeat and LEM domain-containing protein 2-like n=1 Tax=Oppia nitens TaxID=1686743 RepID=UPI0023DA8642|nr:ankyrin repeat and LEM domain-containing protein 2-like [Oppia nitens]
MTNNEINVGDKNQLFYGLSLPSHVVDDINVDKDTELVFDNKNDVLKAMKLYKGSRFKAFHNIDDAIEYSKQVIKPEECCGDSNKSVRNLEKSLSPFSGLHPRELARLRKAIENDSYETVNQLIWSNPRFLVSSGDTPVILMEGFRYNSCHIAAKAGKHNILQLILNTVSDKTFMKLLFPYDADDVTESRIKFLLDLYLNTPEKGFCETPLHFGCKFGYTEVVAVLLKYQICDIEKLNKNSRKPYEVICERKGDEITKRKIQKLFKSQIYLPLFRDDFSAQIGKPVKGVVHDSTVSALAGPMSADEANHLFETLKSPRKSTPQQRKIRLTDSRKGLERIARNICKEMNINWIEFWPFLNCSIDLTADEGLNRLEKHLRTVYYELDSNFNKSKYNYNYSLSESQDMKSDINSLK